MDVYNFLEYIAKELEYKAPSKPNIEIRSRVYPYGFRRMNENENKLSYGIETMRQLYHKKTGLIHIAWGIERVFDLPKTSKRGFGDLGDLDSIAISASIKQCYIRIWDANEEYRINTDENISKVNEVLGNEETKTRLRVGKGYDIKNTIDFLLSLVYQGELFVKEVVVGKSKPS